MKNRNICTSGFELVSSSLEWNLYLCSNVNSLHHQLTLSSKILKPREHCLKSTSQVCIDCSFLGVNSRHAYNTFCLQLIQAECDYWGTVIVIITILPGRKKVGIVWVEAQRDWMRLLEEGVCKCSVACICLHLLFFCSSLPLN